MLKHIHGCQLPPERPYLFYLSNDLSMIRVNFRTLEVQDQGGYQKGSIMLQITCRNFGNEGIWCLTKYWPSVTLREGGGDLEKGRDNLEP